MATVQVVPWTWRDGTVHLEVRGVTLEHEDPQVGGMVTHLHDAGTPSRFVTVCGVQWFGKLSAYGLRASESIDCPECVKALQSMTFQCTMDLEGRL